jgi:hypothetical protein
MTTRLCPARCISSVLSLEGIMTSFPRIVFLSQKSWARKRAPPPPPNSTSFRFPKGGTPLSSLLIAEEEIRVDTELPWKAAKKSCLDSFARLDSGSLEDGSIDISDVGFDRQAVYFRTQNSLCHCTPARRFESRFGSHVFKMLEKGSPGLSPLSSMPLEPFAIPVLGVNRVRFCRKR